MRYQRAVGSLLQPEVAEASGKLGSVWLGLDVLQACRGRSRCALVLVAMLRAKKLILG